jgi:hypothetical protein
VKRRGGVCGTVLALALGGQGGAALAQDEPGAQLDAPAFVEEQGALPAPDDARFGPDQGPPAPDAVDEVAPTAADSPNPLSALKIESLAATRDAPLFTPSRTAPVVEQYVEPEPVVEVAQPVVEEAAPAPPALRLIGVVRTGSEEVALLADENTGQIHRIRPAEEFEGWTLKIVDGRSVEFQNAELSHKLSMFAPGSEPAPSQQVMTPQNYDEGHAFGMQAEDGTEIMGGDLDYSNEPGMQDGNAEDTSDPGDASLNEIDDGTGQVNREGAVEPEY